jgi:hypothetical protein
MFIHDQVQVYILKKVNFLDRWTEHLCSIITKQPTNVSRKHQDLLIQSRFTPTCFSKSLPSSGGCSYLRSYSSNLHCGCIWTFVQWVQFLQNWTHCTHSVTSLENWPLWTGHNPYTSTINCLSSFWGNYDRLMMAVTYWNMLG